MFSDSRTTSRMLAAIGLVVGPLLWIASTAVSPAWADDGAGYLADVASSPDRHLLSGALFLIGSIVILPGLIGTARLLRARRVTLGQIGAYLVAVGALAAGGFAFVLGAIEIAMVDDAANRAEMVALSDRAEESTAAIVGFVGFFFVGLVGGTVLLAIGLWTRRAVPVWSSLLLVAGIVLLFAVGNGPLGSAAGMAVLLAGFAPVARRIATLTDEEWERWEVLPDRSRGMRRSEKVGSPSTV